MSDPSVFFDTNVLLYLLSSDSRKADRAEDLLADGGTISVQVLNEFVAVATRKLGKGWPEIHEFLNVVRAVCRVEAVSLDIHDRALLVAEHLGYSFYDSLIIAAALVSGCDTLYSEDMQHGHLIEGQLTIRNPFIAPGPRFP